MKKHVQRLFIGIGLALVAVSTAAHHSAAMFDSTKSVTLTGTVKEFQWTNPHCWIQLLVPAADDGSKTEEWSIEMASPVQVLQGGWKPRTLKPGDKITVVVHPTRDGTHGGNFVSALSAAGEPIGR
jgi:hypothetical protein